VPHLVPCHERSRARTDVGLYTVRVFLQLSQVSAFFQTGDAYQDGKTHWVIVPVGVRTVCVSPSGRRSLPTSQGWISGDYLLGSTCLLYSLPFYFPTFQFLWDSTGVDYDMSSEDGWSQPDGFVGNDSMDIGSDPQRAAKRGRSLCQPLDDQTVQFQRHGHSDPKIPKTIFPSLCATGNSGARTSGILRGILILESAILIGQSYSIKVTQRVVIIYNAVSNPIFGSRHTFQPLLPKV
jgi:hypothetical protein